MWGRRRSGTGPVVRAAVVGAESHGKSTLVQALTELLPEEYRQSPQPFGQFSTARGPYQLYDSPGIDEFRSRLAGGAEQFGGLLLVVSGEDGPMPGTREYLEAARAAGVTQVVAFLAKSDLVDDLGVQAVVELEIRMELDELGYRGDDCPVVRGSAMNALRDGSSRKARRDLVRLAEALDGTLG